MIISASRRTDLPAFYTPWLMERIRCQQVSVRNPFNARQVRQISLAPEDVTALVFWTRNPEKLLPHLSELDDRGYWYYFQFTITGYGPPLERGTPSPERAVALFAELSRRLGPERVVWRYDPVLLCPAWDCDSHRRQFADLAARLQGLTRQVVISLADLYPRVRQRMARELPEQLIGAGEDSQAQPLSPSLSDLLTEMVTRAKAHGMAISSCAEEGLESCGVPPGRCIDDQRIQAGTGTAVERRKDKGQRPACGCVPSVDIGVYHTCLHGCAYCYATRSDRSAVRNFQRHDPMGAFLLP